MKNEYLIRKTEELDRAIKVDLNLRGNLADMKKRIHSMVIILLMFYKSALIGP